MPGDYATLETPCPNCGGVVKENYRRYTCIGKSGTGTDACGFSFGKTPAGRTFELAEVEQFLRDKQIGPLEGFRSKAGWPFTAEIVLKYDEEDKNWKLEFDFGDDKNAETGEIVDFSGQEPLGPCPKCGGARVRAGQQLRLRASRCRPHAQPDADAATSRAGKIILQQPVEREQMTKLLATGKTDLLDKFVSMRTRRAVQGLPGLGQGGRQGELRVRRRRKFPPRKSVRQRPRPCGGRGRRRPPARRRQQSAPAKKARRPRSAAPRRPKAPRKPRRRPDAQRRAGRRDRRRAGGAHQVIKKLWDYIKANGLQDAANKRAINADAKLLPVFGKPQVTMFELAGIVGKHLS